eukprot:GILI01021602.1.p1 GENE.GILI01021602.1~~GILI01021602.1.p1  ORF type:complete len:129 (-),score=6.68 GILI01021602.1:45-431(-)
MFRTSRQSYASPARRLVEYYKHRDWEQSLQKVSMRGVNKTINNIPWSLIGITTAAILFFGIDLGIGVTQSGRTKTEGSPRHETKDEAEMKKKRMASELFEKRDVSISAAKDLKEGNGPLAQRQARGEI